jgi:predicted transcriptional regulator
MWDTSPEKVHAIVSALSDDYSMKIIASTVSEAKSPEQISQENNIPMSTCYRRIHDLVTLSIIQVSKIDLENGKKSVLYKSAYKDILVKFEGHELAVDLIPNNPAEEDAVHKLQSPAVLVQDCDLCQSKDGVCKVFVTGDSQSYISVCANCEKTMHDRNTIRSIENLTHERLAQAPLAARK